MGCRQSVCKHWCNERRRLFLLREILGTLGDDEDVVAVPADPHGGCVSALVGRLERRRGSPGGRQMIGITGAPGAGKSTLAMSLVAQLSVPGVVVPMDGFHLADEVLDQLGRRDRKGAPDTFDAAGFVHLLRRIRFSSDDVTYAPVFHREQEQAIAGALAVSRDHEVIVVEGNYLLADGAFAPVRTLLDECWYVELPEALRQRRLVDRHVRYGRSLSEAEEWVHRTDEANARFIASTRPLADVTIDVVEGTVSGCSG